MDSLQHWTSAFIGLDDVHVFLDSLSEDDFKRDKVHELFLTWVVARFLQSLKKSPHLVGFPTQDDCEGRTLNDFVFGHLAIDNENFDTVIIDSKKPKEPMRIQVKRYMNRKAPSTHDLFSYIKKVSDRYGVAPEINIVFEVRDNLKFDVDHFWRLAEEKPFKVATIWVFVALPNCILFQVHPNRSRLWWSPS